MISEGDVEAHVHRTGHRWIDISVAICALIVSVTSLWVAVRHGHTMERMAEANARLVSANSYPLLQQFQSNASDFNAVGDARQPLVSSLNVVNSGVGPAKVETLQLFWKGRPVRSIHELLAACCQFEQARTDIDALNIRTSDLQGSMLRAGEVRRLLIIPWSKETMDLAKRFDDGYPFIEMQSCYCSVFDECWVSNLQTLHPQAVAQCPAANQQPKTSD